MRQIATGIIAIAMMFSLVACGNQEPTRESFNIVDSDNTHQEQQVDQENPGNAQTSEETPGTDNPDEATEPNNTDTDITEDNTENTDNEEDAPQMEIDVPSVTDDGNKEDTEGTDEPENTDGNETTVINTRFSDVPRSYAHYNAVTRMVEGGLVTGYGDGTFGPNDSITIGQFAQIMCRVMGLPTGSGETGWWAQRAVESCVDGGYLVDRGLANAANYDKPITREEAIVALQLATDRDAIKENSFSKENIPDYFDISEEFRETILAAYNSGITTGITGTDGSNKFLPKQNITRGEVCQIFYNINWTEAGAGIPVEE